MAARSIKIGARVIVDPRCFHLPGLPEEARGELRVDEYGAGWNGRYTVEAVNPEGDRFELIESELIVTHD